MCLIIGCDIVPQTTPAPPLEKEGTIPLEVGNLRTFILSKVGSSSAVLSAFSAIFAHLLRHIARYAPRQTDKHTSKIQLNPAVDKTTTAS